MFPAVVRGKQVRWGKMANVNKSVYPDIETFYGITFTDTPYNLINKEKTIALNKQYDRTIFPWRTMDITYSAYSAYGSKYEKTLTTTSNNALFTTSSSLSNTTNNSYTKNEIINKSDTSGTGFVIWKPNAGYSPSYYDGYLKNRLVTNFTYSRFAGLAYVAACSQKPTTVEIANTKKYFTLAEYRNNATRYPYVINVLLSPYSAHSGARERSLNSNIVLTALGSSKFNFHVNNSSDKFNLQFEMDECLGKSYRVSGDGYHYGVPVLGIFRDYTGQNYGEMRNLETPGGLNYKDYQYFLYYNNLTPNIRDITAISNPEAGRHQYTAWFEISPDEILQQCLRYGCIVCESEAAAKDLSNSSNDTHVPIFNKGVVTDGHTSGSENSSNPALSWKNPWNDAGYNPNDTNKYTDKIGLNKPNLTTTGIFNRTFALTSSSIKNLADYLWNADETIFNEIVKGLSLMGGNPIDGLIDLRLYPFDVSAKTSGGNSKSIVVGRPDTKVAGLEINDYNAVLELGSCTFFPNFGNFLDYEPFTTASLYIPYVGIVPISTADFMGQTISCKMVVDITTGSCTAIVFANEIPIIYKNGNIGVEIPMTGTNSAEYASRIAGGLTSGATDVALGATSKSVGQVVSGVGSIVDSALSVNNTMYNTAGSSSPACGLWQPQNCYFIIQRPVPIVPENYGHTVGYACNYQAKISECSGYTQTYNVDVSSINAPESEKNAIAEILNSGFYA